MHRNVPELEYPVCFHLLSFLAVLTHLCRCKTVSTLESHHIRHYLKHNHPIAICVSWSCWSYL